MNKQTIYYGSERENGILNEAYVILDLKYIINYNLGFLKGENSSLFYWIIFSNYLYIM